MTKKPTYLDFSTGQDVTEYITRVDSREEIQRVKAAKFDALMIQARFNLDTWRKLWDSHRDLHHTNLGGFYEGTMTAWRDVLRYETAEAKAIGECERVANEKEKS